MNENMINAVLENLNSSYLPEDVIKIPSPRFPITSQ